MANGKILAFFLLQAGKSYKKITSFNLVNNFGYVHYPHPHQDCYR